MISSNFCGFGGEVERTLQDAHIHNIYLLFTDENYNQQPLTNELLSFHYKYEVCVCVFVWVEICDVFERHIGGERKTKR